MNLLFFLNESCKFRPRVDVSYASPLNLLPWAIAPLTFLKYISVQCCNYYTNICWSTKVLGWSGGWVCCQNFAGKLSLCTAAESHEPDAALWCRRSRAWLWALDIIICCENLMNPPLHSKHAQRSDFQCQFSPWCECHNVTVFMVFFDSKILEAP